ncbi:uncharacterized protein [Pyrus communis]|uniref:uncharacterized protein n=1 Tax=Pyrus communis TaxID=23211 RepID=UPI0035C0B48C
MRFIQVQPYPFQGYRKLGEVLRKLGVVHLKVLDVEIVSCRFGWIFVKFLWQDSVWLDFCEVSLARFCWFQGLKVLRRSSTSSSSFPVTCDLSHISSSPSHSQSLTPVTGDLRPRRHDFLSLFRVSTHKFPPLQGTISLQRSTKLPLPPQNALQLLLAAVTVTFSFLDLLFPSPPPPPPSTSLLGTSKTTAYCFHSAVWLPRKRRSKAPAKKQQKRGIDFKKIKRKIGRKLPPPKNATNTEIKSKAIVLPEQSVASEKAGLAVNKKGLTLKELLQQTSHYNPKVRKDALLGMKDLLLRYPEELRFYKYAVVEKLRECIGDDDRLVRDTLHQLFKSVILPGCKEDNEELLISLMMAYIFNAMTHLAIDVRLMAFKFLELAIQCHPPSFFLNAEKILQSFEDILRWTQFFLEDKGKLKTALAGLELCLSLLPCNKREAGSCGKNGAGQGILHAFEPDVPAKSAGCSIIIPKLKDLVPFLVNYYKILFRKFRLAPFLIHNHLIVCCPYLTA